MKLVIACGDRVVKRRVISEELSNGTVGESKENVINANAIAKDVVNFMGAIVDSLVSVALLEVAHRVPPIGLWPLVKTNCTQLKRLTQECV